MSYRQNLIGKLFGESLRVVEQVDIRHEHIYWKVVCEVCGSEKTVSGSALQNGTSSQCNWCYQESRWTIKSSERKKLCVDYLSGMKNTDIMEKYNIEENSRSLIYKILKKEGIKAHRTKESKN